MKLKILALLSLTLIIGACSGGGGGGDGTSSSTVSIAIVTCDGFNTSWTLIQAGDTLVAEDANTTVKYLVNGDGSQSVCELTGSAHLSR